MMIALAPVLAPEDPACSQGVAVGAGRRGALALARDQSSSLRRRFVGPPSCPPRPTGRFREAGMRLRSRVSEDANRGSGSWVALRDVRWDRAGWWRYGAPS